MKPTPDSPGSAQRPGGTLRLVLLLGFGGLLALAAGAGVEALAALEKIHAQEQDARTAFLARSQSIISMRASLDDCGSRIQEYFLSYDPGERSGAARGLTHVFVQIRTALDAYPGASAPEEQDLLRQMRTILAAQQAAVEEGLAADHAGDRERMSRYLYERVLPLHSRLIEATGKMAVLDRRQLSGLDAALIDNFEELRRHLTKLLAIVLGSGLALSIGSIVYILRQDEEARRRYAELAESRREAASLPARLLEAQEQERRSISRELHDEVGQSLGALLVELGRLSSSIQDAGAHERLEGMKAMAERSVNSVRNMALLLRPSMLDDLGLIPALEWQAREVSRRSEIEAEVESSGLPESLPDDYITCIYRIVQEALNNAARHSGGHRAQVKISAGATAITISIHDDGRGFDSKRTRGLGLLGMEERVRTLEGSLQIESKPGAGTTVEARLPRHGF